MVILRLNRQLFIFKFVFIFIVLSIFIYILRILYYEFHQNEGECKFEEAIDVVYTWVNGSDPVFLKKLDTYIKGKFDLHDSSKQRFDDKYELKFSLRSMEKYANWVNHVYIVTNGQIPSWLNLDYEKVTIVTHEEIFKDVFNLPTFSSPAIESNLHRIPGLSKKFIYFNDDIFLGKPTYSEDFFTPGKGFFIYLAWPVPNCAINCPWMYVADAQCDKECFLPDCQMDGGDCTDFDEKKSLQETTTYRENETRSLVLADTIIKVRSKFYQSSISKMNDIRPSTHPSVLIKNPWNVLSVTKNISDIVSKHNGFVMRKEKLMRIRKRKRNFTDRFRMNVRIDGYSASLQHTNRIMNLKYGFKTRKVPSHAPILLDKDILNDMQFTFAKEFAITERNRVRRKDDMQFSFTYYHFIMSEKEILTVDQIFDIFDTDASRTWSDREIRTLLTKLFELPLSYAIVDHFEALLRNCSERGIFPEVPTPSFERYIDSKLPTISKLLVENCIPLTEILLQKFAKRPKYKYTLLPNSESNVFFAMLNSNISDVVSNLDEIRSNVRKFVCLNDNLDETKEDENELVKAILYDFYLSLFPQPSRFELPEDVRNKFSYMSELNSWKQNRNNIKIFVYSVVSVIVCFMFYSLFKKNCCHIAKKLFCRK